jgi:kynurenine formamidase
VEIGNVRLIDLTQPYRGGDPSELGAMSVVRLKSLEEDGMNVASFGVQTHHVTHLDAPLHLVRDGLGIADITLTNVSGPAVGLHTERGAGEAITADELQSQTPAVEPGDIVFIHTGWDRYFATEPERYLVSPYLGSDAAEWLSSLKVKVVGVDGPTPEMPKTLRGAGFDFPVHRLFLGGHTLICEHMTNLGLLVGRRFRAFLFPLPIVDGDGSPVRAVAELGDDD